MEPENRILKSRLIQHLAALARAPRVPGTPEHSRAADYIRGCFKDMGYPTSFQGVNDGCKNILAHGGLANDPLLVVGAHYDSVPGSPGADDNASGVAALLEVAREFTSVQAKLRVQFVAYDREEEGLLGSISHAKALRAAKTDLYGMLSLEMLGFTSHTQGLVPGVKVARAEGDFLAVVANGRSGWLLNAFEGTPPLALPVERLVVEQGTQAAQLARLSDHGAFWAQGWPALLVTDTAFLRNPHYHQASDTPDTLDIPFLRMSAWKVFEAILRLTS
jgi:Zn-dependent M28 family amino/carboxypeptidase